MGHPLISKLYPRILLTVVLVHILPSLEISIPKGNATDLQALISFKAGITNDPLGVLSSWNGTNTTAHFCNWSGVACGAPRHPDRVTALSMASFNLTGTLSPYLANLSFLHKLDLSNNHFQGRIPLEFGQLYRLQHLNLSVNLLEGNIPHTLTHCSKIKTIILAKNSLVGLLPDNFSQCQSLVHMRLGSNQLSGTIPASLGSLPNLFLLTLGTNQLSGGIPPSFGNLSSLKYLDLVGNHLEGRIPEDFGKLSRLVYLAVTVNRLSGEIPSSIYNLSSMHYFNAGNNSLSGVLPPDMGSTLPSLQQFYVFYNQLRGLFPSSLSNASRLREFTLHGNMFSGTIPRNLGSLPNLTKLDIGLNKLEAGDWGFLDSLTNCSRLSILYLTENNLQGPLPRSIANLSTEITWLAMAKNNITGNIPMGIGKLSRLSYFDMSHNLLTGVIPPTVGMFPLLHRLDLSNNHFQGQIPGPIGNLAQLNLLDLSSNNLQGSIPTSVGNLAFLGALNLSHNELNGSIPGSITWLSSLSRYLDLSHNMLTGKLPQQIGSLINLNALDVSENRLSGGVPGSIGGCQLLGQLLMQGNSFEGVIPSGLSGLRGIQELDLSRNKLSGLIPEFIGTFNLLYYLNLSFNDFRGQVPQGGVFDNVTAVSILGNDKLCGGHQELNLQPCNSSHGSPQHKVIVAVVLVFIFFLAVPVGYYLWKKKLKISLPIAALTSVKEPFARISYNEIYKATDGFSSSNLIGTGSFGSVYKGFMDSGPSRTVAIKILNLEQPGAEKTFIAECDILREIRHRNLVNIITVCSSVDRNGNDFKALIMEYMSNGNLDVWLHARNNENNSDSRSLNLKERWLIVMDVALALDYLHSHCQTPIVHCDLKPSNILLDHDMGAHVGDFGLSRFLHRTSQSTEDTDSTIGIKGSIGYIAPEYGMGGVATTEGDVHSYGVLLLETFTGRRPTNDIFQGDLNLHKYVEMAYPDRVLDVVDPSILLDGDSDTGEYESLMHKCMSSVLRIGLMCSSESPSERLKMEDVLRELLLVKEETTG